MLEQDTYTDTAERYRRAGIGDSVRRGSRPAVLVVDFSVGFTDPSCQIGSDLDAELAATARLLDTARVSSVPILFTTIVFEIEQTTAWLQKAPGFGVLRRETSLVELDGRLGRRATEPVLEKRGASAFFGTDLADRLDDYTVDTLVICGATTSGCVRASAVDALQYDYPTLVVADCVGDRDTGPHEASLFDIQAKYGDVVALGDALGYLEGVACQHSASG